MNQLHKKFMEDSFPWTKVDKEPNAVRLPSGRIIRPYGELYIVEEW